MIFIYSYPRSGSSLLHRVLVKALNYNDIFEPFGYLPSKLKYENFKFIQSSFKAAPKIEDIIKYKIRDFFIASIPENEFSSNDVLPYRNELKNYFSQIYNVYGKNSVIKFVRQQTNVKFIHNILVEIGIEPNYIFLKRDPIEIIYSYYRGGYKYSFMSWYSKDFCAYKENIYGQNEFFSNSKNEIDKIFSSILSDYKVFDDCNVWLLNNNFKSELIEYENFIKNPYDIINKISLNFLDKKTKFNLEYFTFNNKKLDSSKLDRIFISNIRKSIRNLKLKGYFQDGEFKLNYISIRNYLFNTFLFHYPIRMIEAINRRILKKFNSKGKI